MEQKRWVFYYFAALFVTTCVLTIVALQKLPPDRSLEYDIIIAGVSAFIFISPSLLVNALSYLNLQLSVVRSLSRGWLVWVVIMDTHILMLTAQPNAVAVIQVYILDVAIGLLLLSAFRMPHSYAMLALAFPGPAILYFLVLGQIRGGQ